MSRIFSTPWKTCQSFEVQLFTVNRNKGFVFVTLLPELNRLVRQKVCNAYKLLITKKFIVYLYAGINNDFAFSCSYNMAFVKKVFKIKQVKVKHWILPHCKRNARKKKTTPFKIPKLLISFFRTISLLPTISRTISQNFPHYFSFFFCTLPDALKYWRKRIQVSWCKNIEAVTEYWAFTIEKSQKLLIEQFLRNFQTFKC